jgi:hypothetical protein
MISVHEARVIASLAVSAAACGDDASVVREHLLGEIERRANALAADLAEPAPQLAATQPEPQYRAGDYVTATKPTFPLPLQGCVLEDGPAPSGRVVVDVAGQRLYVHADDITEHRPALRDEPSPYAACDSAQQHLMTERHTQGDCGWDTRDEA